MSDWRCVMMRRCVLFVGIALVLPLAPSATPSAQEWPSKGDSVYVAASFAKVRSATTKGYYMELTVKACEFDMEIVDAKPEKGRWVVGPAILLGGTIQLEGAWLPKMHKTEEACRSQYSTEGEPNAKRSGQTFKITQAKPK